jgi:hypothetical protein
MRLSLLLSAWVGHVAASTFACDVLVAGGSLSSLAAAVTAANATGAPAVCFLELTDWAGGQMTASAVPAIDFGPYNAVPENLPASFAALLFGPLMPHATNLGACWVSKKCFSPTLVMDSFLNPLIASLPNLAVFLRTAVSFVTRDANGTVTSLTAIQRTPRSGDGWEELTSAQVVDWYDPADSQAYTKETLEFTLSAGGVVIEATEFGDVLATAALPFAQGIEVPAEDSRAYLSSCGQGMTVPFYATWGLSPAPSPDPWPPGSGEGAGFSQQGMGWDRDWTYRRIAASPDANASAGAPGETSVINVGGGDDIDNAYLFYALGSPELQAQLAKPGAWRGGVNASALAAAEQRAYGFYHWFKANASGAAFGNASGYITLNASQAGTATGLAKMPYLRDARRSAGGLGGFRVFKANLSTPGAWPRAAVAWPDTVAIGQYFYADIHEESKDFCPYPAYIVAGANVLPYYIPFRALTVEGAPNVLVAGKNLAMSFYANAAIRLHPEEWSTGAAAGVAAALMHQHQWTTQEALDNIVRVRAAVAAQGIPLNWTLPPQF